MSGYVEIAAVLVDSLHLSLPPIAVSLADQAPEGLPRFSGRAAAGCQFWELAASGGFVTEAGDHDRCAIGVYTHNLHSPSAGHERDLGDALRVMDDLGYLKEADLARVPVLWRRAPYVVYAPLASAPSEPDVVLVFADGRQGLVITEAVQRVEPETPPALGRPACAIVPQAANTGRAALSLGCCGARVYVDALSDDVALWAFPGKTLAAYAEQVAVLARANDILGTFHRIRRQDVEAGRDPSVAESLGRMPSA